MDARSGTDIDGGRRAPAGGHHGESAARSQLIADVFAACFGDQARVHPGAFRMKFRKMAANAVAFYRGSACLFYADLAAMPDEFATGTASRVWIHGDCTPRTSGPT